MGNERLLTEEAMIYLAAIPLIIAVAFIWRRTRHVPGIFMSEKWLHEHWVNREG